MERSDEVVTLQLTRREIDHIKLACVSAAERLANDASTVAEHLELIGATGENCAAALTEAAGRFDRIVGNLESMTKVNAPEPLKPTKMELPAVPVVDICCNDRLPGVSGTGGTHARGRRFTIVKILQSQLTRNQQLKYFALDTIGAFFVKLQLRWHN